MKCSPFARRINPARRAFTLVEVMVASALFGGLALIAFSVLHSGMILSGQNTGMNVSAARGRQMIDWIGEEVRYSCGQPVLINTTGVPIATTTGDGILLKKLIGTPYVVKETTGTTADIKATDTQFVLEYRADLPKPLAGDWILVESVERPELEISLVVDLAAANGVNRCRITTVQALGELAKPTLYRVGGVLFRREAFVFAPTSDATQFELRFYYRVRSTTVFSSASAFQELAESYRKLSGQAFFTESTINSQKTTTLRTLVHSSGRAESFERGNTASTYTTIPVQLRLWALDR